MILEHLLAYVRLDEDDRVRLIDLHARLETSFPMIAERFYEAVWADPKAAALLSGPEQVERLRSTLIDWMSTGLLGPYDHAFNERRSRIGRVHVRVGLAQHYMFTGMNVVRAAYLDRIRELYPTSEALDVVRSVDKLFDIELALMLRHYQLDSEDRLLTRERTIQSDRVNALQTMSAGLAHAVRNPLNAAKLQLELLERRVRRNGDDPKLVDPIHLAHHEIERLTELLNEFLAFAHPPALHLMTHDALAVVRDVVDLERPLAERSGVSLVLDEKLQVAVVLLDPQKLHQVIQNLVRNAIEAAPRGGRVDLEVAFDQGCLHVRVSDDGRGMTDDVRARLFEPFFSTKEAGTGIGMSIVHSLVAMHDGRIEIVTGPTGTTFDVAFPTRCPARA